MSATQIRSVLTHSRRRILGTLGCAATLVAALVVPATAHAAPVPSSGTAAMPQIVPKPVSTTVEHGTFTLTPRSRIVVARGSRSAWPVAQDLARDLRPATGYRLPVVVGRAHHGDISLQLGTPADLPAGHAAEGYELDTNRTSARLEAPSAHGLFDGVQTIRQLLPVWIASNTREPGPWTMPAVHIVDYPRYAYRGVMLDIARHYQTPQSAMKLIDQASAYKVDVFHLHLSDDQGFRVVINGFPNLTKIGGMGSVGTGGRTMDPGGFWTQAQYKQVVAYAAAHFMTLVPEVDSPGHNNAIIMSEYNDTANPLLNGHPQDINCSLNHPPVWNYTTAVGYSALCPESQNTWTIYSAIIDQLTAMSPGPYYDLGGDEVPSTVLSQAQYASFINKESGIVTGQGKTVMGWADIAGPGSTPPAGSVAEYWNPASGSDPGTITGTEAVAKGMKLVMAPANHAYLDQKYVFGTAGNVPATLGLHWACNTGCDVDQFYNWDPASYVTGVTDANVLGVEAAIWGETTPTFGDVDYLVFPRLLATAEIGWSPKADRTSTTSPAYLDFVQRLAAQGARFTLAGTNFYPTPEVPWRLDLAAGNARIGHGGQVAGTLASLAAPGMPAGTITATIRWGDGSTSTGTVSGTPASDTMVNGLYSVTGQHSYRHHGVYRVTITASAPGTPTVTVHTTLRWTGRHHRW